MKKNTSKIKLLPPAEIIDKMDLPHPSQSEALRTNWLKSAIGEDVNAIARQARLLQAEFFLLTSLYPLLDSRAAIDEDVVVDLILRHMNSASAMAKELTINLVLGAVLNRLDCYDVLDLETKTEPSEMLIKDLSLLEILGKLDLDAIDRRVSAQRHQL